MKIPEEVWWFVVIAGMGGGCLFWMIGAIDKATDAIDKATDRQHHEERLGPCRETATLVATTAGSPNEHTCPNVAHRMRVQVQTTATKEEVAAIVFCECVRDGG